MIYGEPRTFEDDCRGAHLSERRIFCNVPRPARRTTLVWFGHNSSAYSEDPFQLHISNSDAIAMVIFMSRRFSGVRNRSLACLVLPYHSQPCELGGKRWTAGFHSLSCPSHPSEISACAFCRNGLTSVLIVGARTPYITSSKLCLFPLLGFLQSIGAHT